jgi:hypothetical protein
MNRAIGILVGSLVVICLWTATCNAVFITLPTTYDSANSRYHYTLPVDTPFLRLRPTIHNDTEYQLTIFPAGHNGYSGALPEGSSYSPGPDILDSSSNNSDYLAQFTDQVLIGYRYYDVKLIPPYSAWTLGYGVWTFGSSGPANWINQDFDIDGIWAYLRIDYAGASTPGDSPDLPLMPESSVNGFNFSVELADGGRGIDWPVFIDPAIAVGYAYSVPSDDPAFASVYIADPLPMGDEDFELIVNDISYTLTAGTPFDLTTINEEGVRDFIIQGIDPSEQIVPDETGNFVTGLTFVGGATTAHVSMVPILIPEPSSLSVMLIALMGSCLVAKRHC